MRVFTENILSTLSGNCLYRNNEISHFYNNNSFLYYIRDSCTYETNKYLYTSFCCFFDFNCTSTNCSNRLSDKVNINFTSISKKDVNTKLLKKENKLTLLIHLIMCQHYVHLLILPKCLTFQFYYIERQSICRRIYEVQMIKLQDELVK